MTLVQLVAFLAAAETGSFTAAARKTGATQASVSELIRRLEEEHDTLLFVRGSRRLVLTMAGQELVEHAAQAVAAAEAGSRAIRSVQTLQRGVATFGVPRNVNYYVLTELVAQFQRKHPEVRVRLVGLNSTFVASAIADGSLEAGLVVLPVDLPHLSVRPLLRDEVLFASSDPERVKNPVTIDQLAQARLILYDAHAGGRDPTRRQIEERAQLAGIKLEPRIEVEHVESALTLVSRGLGDTFVSRAVAQSPAMPARIATASFDPPVFDTLALVTREGRPLSVATRELAWMCQQMLRSRAGAESIGDAQGNPMIEPT